MSGAAKLVTMSSFPVLTSVSVEVSINNESDVRKNRSAGRAGALGDERMAAMPDFFIVAPAGFGRNEAGRKYNSQLLAEATAARAAWATFLVRLETGRLEMSVSGTRFAPETRGRFFTSMRKGKRVMAR